MTRLIRLPLLGTLFAAALCACTVGPNYSRPSAATAPHYKELEGWKISTPDAASMPRGPWWSIYQDPQLDSLEQQVEVSNQTLKASEAAYRQAQALVAEARAQLFPTLGASVAVQRSGSGSGSGTSSGATSSGGAGVTIGSGARTVYELQANASWEIDVWGRVRRMIESNEASAQASAADVASARLSAQASLATTYFNLRADDEQSNILQQSVKVFERNLSITENQYRGGTAARSDVITAQTQLEQTRTQAIAIGVQRALNEHAIAVLMGRAPADFSLAAASFPSAVPVVPVGLPSELLERRPDIAAAERSMAASNAQIGVAVAAYYPTLTLSATGGFQGDPIDKLVRAANRIWSLGASASDTLFDAGLRGAQVDAARAAYDQQVADYRQTVLTAFQQVEDELSSLRILEQQAQAEARTVELAKQAATVAMNEYRAGTVPFTTVLTAQATLLSAQQTALGIQQSRLGASVSLVQAVGGGWMSAQLRLSDHLALGSPGKPAAAAP